MPTTPQQAVVDAALKQLGADDHLIDLGIVRQYLAKPAGVSRTTVDNHLAKGKLHDALGAEYRRQMKALVRLHAERYKQMTDLMTLESVTQSEREERLRLFLKHTLAEDLVAYLPATDPNLADEERSGVIGRERFYWLCVALSDRPTSPNAARGVAETTLETQESYLPIYKAISGILRRVPLEGDTEKGYRHVQRTVNTFLEGHIVFSRLGVSIDDDALVDGVLALFRGLTRPQP